MKIGYSKVTLETELLLPERKELYRLLVKLCGKDEGTDLFNASVRHSGRLRDPWKSAIGLSRGDVQRRLQEEYERHMSKGADVYDHPEMLVPRFSPKQSKHADRLSGPGSRTFGRKASADSRVVWVRPLYNNAAFTIRKLRPDVCGGRFVIEIMDPEGHVVGYADTVDDSDQLQSKEKKQIRMIIWRWEMGRRESA